jgi:uncharacterized protein
MATARKQRRRERPDGKITAGPSGLKPSPRKAGPIESRYTAFRLRIRRSRIHGFGVFALEVIPKGKLVVEYSGELISRAAARRRFLRAWFSRGRRLYLARLNSYWVVDGAQGGSGAELINHSCDPNLQWKRFGGRLFFVARRRIRRGEELLLDYSFRKDGPRVVCRCGAASCRGTINTK